MIGAQVDVPTKRVPSFRPGRELRALVNGEGDCERLGNNALDLVLARHSTAEWRKTISLLSVRQYDVVEGDS